MWSSLFDELRLSMIELAYNVLIDAIQGPARMESFSKSDVCKVNQPALMKIRAHCVTELHRPVQPVVASGSIESAGTHLKASLLLSIHSVL